MKAITKSSVFLFLLSLFFLNGCANTQPIVPDPKKQAIYNQYLSPENKLKHYLRHVKPYNEE